MKARSMVRALATVAAVGAIALVTAGSASADRTTVDRYEWPTARVYDNVIAPIAGLTAAEADLVLVAGTTGPNLCTELDDDPDNDVYGALADEVDRISADGLLIHERIVSQRATLEVYDGGGLPFYEWAVTVLCPSLADPGVPDVLPLATGVGNLKDKSVVDIREFPFVTIDSVNSVRGTVVTGDGERWAVRGSSVNVIELEIDPATGIPISVVQTPALTAVEVLNRR